MPFALVSDLIWTVSLYVTLLVPESNQSYLSTLFSCHLCNSDPRTHPEPNGTTVRVVSPVTAEYPFPLFNISIEVIAPPETVVLNFANFPEPPTTISGAVE